VLAGTSTILPHTKVLFHLLRTFGTQNAFYTTRHHFIPGKDAVFANELAKLVTDTSAQTLSEVALLPPRMRKWHGGDDTTAPPSAKPDVTNLAFFLLF
jgi:hypothetical protein